MPLPKAPTRRPNNATTRQADAQADTVLLFKGIFYALIGISVLLAPDFITTPKWHNIAAKASLAGWFAVVLGVAFGLLFLKRNLTALKRKG